MVGIGTITFHPKTTVAQNTYVVDSNNDEGDYDPGDGECAVTVSGGGCTLRAAIEEANQTSDKDIIEFDIPGTGSFTTIALSEVLEIRQPVTIDGSTSPEHPSSVGGPAIVLDGSSLSTTQGIDVLASDVTINALGVNSFAGTAIEITSGNTGVTIKNCFLGIAIDDGESDEGNGFGVDIKGDNFTLDGNVISYNTNRGVRIGANNGSVLNNTIGLDHDEDQDAGNASGITVSGDNNLIGNAYVGQFVPVFQGNTIAGSNAGISISGDNNQVYANLIGTNGSSAFPNETGIEVHGSSSSDPAEGNAIGSGDAIKKNVISGNQYNGIRLGNGGNDRPANNNTIRNNRIGVTSDASAPLGNGQGNEAGIRIDYGSGNTIDANVIGGNDPYGIWVRGSESTGQTITGNYIGTNASGTDLGNVGNGIQLDTSPSSNSDEIEVYGENVIGFNGGDGVSVQGNYHDVTNNYIGTNPDGDDIGNDDEGVQVGADNVFVGEATVGGSVAPGNVIGNNDGDGILILNASEVTLRRNYIGTDENHANLGNGSNGLRIVANSGLSSNGNTVGYAASQTIPTNPSPSNGEDGNVIANNGADGVLITGGGNPVDNAVRGNLISNNGNADNTDIGIDLGGDGVTANDNASDDSDTGPNNLQNFPVIEDVSHDDANDEVTITYRVQTATGNAAYPLQIDFYATDSESSGEGKTYIGTQEYTSSDARSSLSNVIDLSQFSNVTKDDHFVATATDADGNTSEFVDTSEPLPVELASFEATQSEESTVALRWTTASEQNSAGFDVQRRSVETTDSESAAERGTWEQVGFVESKADGGSTSEATTYRFTAEDLEVGTHEFRLKQTDLDGTEHVHDPVAVKLQMQETLRLGAPAPNPVQTRARLSFAVKEQAETTLTLYNTLGQQVRTVYRGTPAAGESQTTQIETAGLASGVYFLRLQSGGQLKTQRVTVVR